MEDKQSVIIGNANIITFGKENKIIENGAILVEDGIIKKIGNTEEIKSAHKDIDFIDFNGLWMMPGNIIAHTHLYSTFARGMALKDEAPSNFVEILQRLWWRLDKALTQEDIYFSALVYLIQCIKSGTTTIIDHHASPSYITNSLDVLSQAIFESGIRASLCYEVSDRDGKEKAEKGIEENIRFLRKCKEYPTRYVKGAFGIHASFTVSDETMKKCIEAAKEEKATIHIHVEEDLADRKDSEEKYGVPVLKRLDNLGATEVPILAIHCVHITPQEIELAKQKDIYIVHNPSSNMNNAVGVAPVLKMMDENIIVGLGTDGMSADLFWEMKILPLLHKVNTGDPRTFSFDKIQKILKNNTQICNLFWKEAQMGAIEEGYFADVIGIKYDPPTPLTPENVLGHLLFGIDNSMVDTTIVNGQILMKERKLLHLDEKYILQKSRELAKKMWDRF